MATRRQEKDQAFLEGLLGGPLTFGMAIEALRKGEGMSQAAFARRLRIPQQKLCDIEKGRRNVSPERAAAFARRLGHPVTVFVQLALQDQVRDGGLKLKVRVEGA